MMTTDTAPYSEPSSEPPAIRGFLILLLAVFLGAVFYLAFVARDTLPTAIKYRMEKESAAESSTDM